MPPRRGKARGRRAPHLQAKSAEGSLKARTRLPTGRCRQFPFMKLPPEIRNMIYVYAVPSKTTIKIRVVLPDEREKILKADDTLRTNLMRVMECKPGPRDGAVVSETEMTTYTASQAEDIADFVSLSASNRRLRGEIMPIFYGTNTFHFVNWKAFQPFLADRSLEALQLMKSVEISIPWQGPIEPWRYNKNKYNEFPPAKVWNCMLTKKQAFTTLHLEKLFIHINTDTTTLRFHWASLGPWIRKRYGPAFTNLDRLGVQVHTAEQGHIPSWMHHRAAHYFPQFQNGLPENFVEIRGDDLWNALAPRMLKHCEGRVHEGPELQDRRIFPA